MEANIKLLEERVNQAVERLRALSAERKQLESEVDSLRRRLESAQHDGSTFGTDKNQEGWRSERAETIDAIRRTLDELREA